MRRRRFLKAGLSLVAGTQSLIMPTIGQVADPATSGLHDSTDPITGSERGPWRRLFLDSAAYERTFGVVRRFHAAQRRSPQPVLQRDKPWEGVAAIVGPYMYGTVLKEQDRLRMWYQFLSEGNHVGYAESTDGVFWTKPELGIVDYQGSRNNNLVVSAYDPGAAGGGHCHNPSVIRCPANGPADYLLYGFDSRCGHPRVATSPDGLHWRYREETASTPLFTSSDVVNFCYDPYERRYFATWKTRNRRGRAVGIAWSDDGLSWSKPFNGPVFVPDDHDPDTTQVYGMPVFPYQGLYIGLPWIYHARYFRYGEYSVDRLHEAQADSPRTMDVQLAWSWDLVNWTRPAAREAFLSRGDPEAWDWGMVVTARAPVLMNDQLWFYYGGFSGVHDDRRVSAAIGVATLRIDGFCSMAAGDSDGWLITRREPFRDPAVMINARTSSNGAITAEIVDRHNEVVPGFERENCQPFRGDAVRHRLSWRTTQFPAQPPADDYKIKFWLQSAELFSYLPCGLDPAQHDLVRFPHSGP